MQEQDAQQVQKEDRNRPTLLFIKKVDLPAFGPHAYYGEWQDANKPSTVIRQRIYGFTIDEEEAMKAIVRMIPEGLISG